MRSWEASLVEFREWLAFFRMIFIIPKLKPRTGRGTAPTVCLHIAHLIIIPGWRDPGPGHWQSLWAEQLPGAVRVQQDDWITPSRKAWVASIGKTILEQAGPVRTAGAYARAWGSEFVRLQNAGHINVDSGFGAWPLGLTLLQSL